MRQGSPQNHQDLPMLGREISKGHLLQVSHTLNMSISLVGTFNLYSSLIQVQLGQIAEDVVHIPPQLRHWTIFSHVTGKIQTESSKMNTIRCLPRFGGVRKVSKICLAKNPLQKGNLKQSLMQHDPMHA
jgi:hypothetical protein